MMTYKNMTQFTKTLHGVKFKPGEVHTVSGYINIPGFIQCEEVSAPVVAPAQSTSTKKATTKSTLEEV